MEFYTAIGRLIYWTSTAAVATRTSPFFLFLVVNITITPPRYISQSNYVHLVLVAWRILIYISSSIDFLSFYIFNTS